MARQARISSRDGERCWPSCLLIFGDNQAFCRLGCGMPEAGTARQDQHWHSLDAPLWLVPRADHTLLAPHRFATTCNGPS